MATDHQAAVHMYDYQLCVPSSLLLDSKHPLLPYWPLQGGATFYISLITCTSVLIQWHTKSWFSNWHLLKDENFCVSSAHWYLHEDVSLISWIPLLFQVLTWIIPCWKHILPKQCACFFFLHSPAHHGDSKSRVCYRTTGYFQSVHSAYRLKFFMCLSSEDTTWSYFLRKWNEHCWNNKLRARGSWLLQISKLLCVIFRDLDTYRL